MFVQLEIYNSANVKKYAPGQKLVFKTKDLSDDWLRRNIVEIKYQDSLIIFENSFVHVNDITQVRVFNPVPFTIAKGLYLFAAQSLVFGGVSDLVNGTFNWQLVTFTVAPTALGIFLDKISYKKYTMGKNSRVRLLDLRMF